jgi:hypothetical protein
MKYLLALFVCLLFGFGACKKDGVGGPPNTISATVNGVNINFNAKAIARMDTSVTGPTGVTLNITGETNTEGVRSFIAVSVSTYSPDGPIAAGTYLSLGTNSQADFSYLFYTEMASDTQPGQTYVTDATGKYLGSVTISSISRTSVAGTFSGMLVSSSGDTTTTTVTNGKFNVSIGN